MTKILTIKLKVMIVGCILLLAWGVWPGLLSEYSFLISIATVFLMLFLLANFVHFIFSIIRQLRNNPADAKTSFFRFIVGAAILVLTVAIWWLQIPLRIPFYFCKTSFEPFVKLAPTSEYVGETHALNKRLGIWYVDQYAVDPRGGTYFRIASGQEGFGPDVISYGFAFKPNLKGSPFGNARYYCSNLVGHWYYFEVSDDW